MEQLLQLELRKKKPLKRVAMFLIPSILGIFLFMIPISYNDNITIPIAVLSGLVQEWLVDYLPAIMTGIILLTLIGTILMKTVRPEVMNRNPFIKSLLDVPPVWFAARILGAIFAACVQFKLGSEMIWSENTGGMLLNSLLPVLFSVFLFAGLFLPLLLDFGLIGTASDS